MATYRVDNHHGVTIVEEGNGGRCGRPGHDCDRGHLVAVVVDGGQELAERICALLNAYMPSECTRVGEHNCDGEWRNHDRYEATDSCTCPPPSGPRTMPDPLCVVHRGRRARGPKPPPLGPGCICDGSGRTCPRHGAVI
jgi:hypothetical protein